MRRLCAFSVSSDRGTTPARSIPAIPVISASCMLSANTASAPEMSRSGMTATRVIFPKLDAGRAANAFQPPNPPPSASTSAAMPMSSGRRLRAGAGGGALTTFTGRV